MRGYELKISMKTKMLGAKLDIKGLEDFLDDAVGTLGWKLKIKEHKIITEI